jgi:hypothetical protein
MKAYGKVEVSLHSFLTSALQGGEQSASSLDCFTPWERSHRHHWLEGWVGPSVSLSILEKSKIPYSCQELKLWYPGCVVCRLVSMLTETWWLQQDRYKTQQQTNSNKCHMLEYTAADTINIIHKQTWKQHKTGEKNHIEITKHKAKIKKNAQIISWIYKIVVLMCNVTSTHLLMCNVTSTHLLMRNVTSTHLLMHNVTSTHLLMRNVTSNA